MSRTRLRPIIFIGALCGFVLLGVPIATFHGDESMQIYMSSDYAALFIDRAPERLWSVPPFDIDSDAHLRLINGSVNRTLIGLSWHLAGYTRGALPPRPGWDWGLSYTDNVATGHRPDSALLTISRLSSAALTALSVVLVFATAARISGPPAAVFASAVYALHPVILLNGRRAMQEGAMLAFGMLAIYAAVRISAESSAPSRRRTLLLWGLLILAGALTLASKHSGVIFIAGAFAWIGVDVLIAALRRRHSLARAARRVGALAVSAALTLALWVALSPALWSDPVARIGDLLTARAELLGIQVAIDPRAPLALPDRLSEALLQPFVAPAQHYEIAAWGEEPAVQAEVAAYTASPLSGIPFGAALGIPLTLLALTGLIAALRMPGRAGLIVWTGCVLLALMANPLPWQRYYLPLIPPAALAAALGITAIVDALRRMRAPVGSRSHA